MKKIIPLIIVILITISIIPEAYSQNYEIRGSVREWIKNYIQEPQDRGLMETRVKLELLSSMGESSAFQVKSYYIYDGISKEGEWDFQEAYIDLYFSWGDFRLGKQIVAWGKADELNPTDILNPQRLGNFSEEKNIRKIGLTMFKGSFWLGENTLTVVWKPEFDYYRFPVDNPRFSFIPIPGIGEIQPIMPENDLKNTEWALKIERTFGLYDLSVSYFDGWENIFTPSFTYYPDLQTSVMDKLIFNRIKMISADVAGSLHSFGIWGEVAYYRTEDGEGNDMFIKNPYIQMVAGSDYTFMNGLKINVQYFKEFITKIDNDQEEETESNIISRLGLGIPIRHAFSSRLSRSFGSSEQHSADIFTLYDIENNGYLIQPKIMYSPEDALNLEFGLNLYSGDSDSMFGRFDKNDEVYFKATFSF
ncbi:MAG: hypothetical protein GY863_24455 [bacterium]|nr:hypothetical protein [bacterium]